jgi:hypothetical protein
MKLPVSSRPAEKMQKHAAVSLLCKPLAAAAAEAACLAAQLLSMMPSLQAGSSAQSLCCNRSSSP